MCQKVTPTQGNAGAWENPSTGQAQTTPNILKSQEITIPCNFDSRTYKTKPPESEIGGIKSRIGKNPCELPLEQVVHAVACNGQAMGFFKCNGAKSEHFVSARQFGLDFDNESLTAQAKVKESILVKEYTRQDLTLKEARDKVEQARESKDFMPIITFEEVKARLEKNNVAVGYAFYTPSHERICNIRKKTLPKFKVFVVVDEVITNPEEAKQILYGLIYLFPEVDDTGKDLARITFGSTKGLCCALNTVVTKKSILTALYKAQKAQAEADKQLAKYGKKVSLATVVLDYKLEELYEKYPLLERILQQNPHCTPKDEGDSVLLTPHPIYKNDKSDNRGFRYYKNTNTFYDFSTGESGNIINWVVSYEGHTKTAARNIVKQHFGIASKKKESQGGGASNEVLSADDVIATIGRENILYTKAAFWKWNAKLWQRIEDIEIKQVIQQLEKAKNPKLSAAYVNNVCTLIQNEMYKADFDFDADKNGICVDNGELHHNDGVWELRAHSRESYRTSLLPITYDYNATAPRFERFLEEIFHNDDDSLEKQILVCEALGYALLSSCQYEKFFLLIGNGANGKSVFLTVLTALLGQRNVCAVQPSQFENRFQRAHMHNKLANVVTELAEGAVIADAELKAIVSGELLTAEHKLKPPFDFRPHCTCFFATNHLPHTRDFSQALFRRTIIIPFNRIFSEHEQNRNLVNELLAERPGILNLALAAIGAVFKRGYFTEPQSCNTTKAEWRLEADQIAQFTAERCTLDNTAKIPTSDLYKSYTAWASDAGIRRTLNKNNFSNRISRLGIERGKGTGGERILYGIRLTPTL